MTLLIIFLICLAVSAFFSVCEMAFVSSNQLKVRERADEGNSSAKKLLKYYDHPQYLLSAILIGNNLVNIIGTAAITVFFNQRLGIHNEWLISFILVPIIVIFGEMVPKDYGRIHSDKFLLSRFSLIQIALYVLNFPVKLLLWIMDRILGRFRTLLQKNIFVSQNEFRMLIEESTRTGVLDEHERHLINAILDFERTPIASVMVPLQRVTQVEIRAKVGDVKRLARQSKSRMVLVYEEIPAIVVGMIYVYDLLFEDQEDKSLKEYLRSPIFLSSSTSVEKAFLTLQQKRQSYAVVMDHNLEAVGVTPIERLIEF